MVICQILLNVVLIALFMYSFYKVLKKGQTTYFAILVIESISILLNLLHIKYEILDNLFSRIIIYVLSIIMPIAVICMENKQLDITEFLLIKISKLFVAMKRTKRAKQILLNLEKEYPNNPEIHRVLASIYGNEGGLRKSIDEYVKALEMNKSDYDSYYKIAELLTELNQTDEAIEMLNNLTKAKQDYYMAFRLLGNLLTKKEMFKEALNAYLQTEEHISSDDYETYYNMGTVYARLNDFQNAQKCYEKAIQINKHLYVAFYNLAQIALIFNDKETAERYFTQSLPEEDLIHLAYFELSKIYLQNKAPILAVETLNKALDILPTMMEQVNNEVLFVPIKKDIILPAEEREKTKSTLTETEQKVIQHLEDTYKLVGKLNYKQ